LNVRAARRQSYVLATLSDDAGCPPGTSQPRGPSACPVVAVEVADVVAEAMRVLVALLVPLLDRVDVAVVVGVGDAVVLRVEVAVVVAVAELVAVAEVVAVVVPVGVAEEVGDVVRDDVAVLVAVVRLQKRKLLSMTPSMAAW